MERRIKLLAASSIVALATTACAPNGAYDPYNNNQYQAPTNNYNGANVSGGSGVNKAPVTHSHGGKVHSHPLPATGLRHTHATGGGNAYTPSNTYTAPTNTYTPPVSNNAGNYAGNNSGGTPHAHCGRTHSHPLPAQGLAHIHGDPACPGGGGNVAAPQPQPIPVQPNANNGTTQPNNYGYYDYAYGGTNNNPAPPNTNTGNTGNTGTNNDSYYSYGGTPNNTTNYYDNVQPKPPASYYDNSNNTGSTDNYNYTPPAANTNTGSSSGDSGSFAPNNYSGGNSYTVQRGDTVFQVMRNTGIYWKDIIRLNNLQAPNYQINPGQTLRLR